MRRSPPAGEPVSDTKAPGSRLAKSALSPSTEEYLVAGEVTTVRYPETTSVKTKDPAAALTVATRPLRRTSPDATVVGGTPPSGGGAARVVAIAGPGPG